LSTALPPAIHCSVQCMESPQQCKFNQEECRKDIIRQHLLQCSKSRKEHAMCVGQSDSDRDQKWPQCLKYWFVWSNQLVARSTKDVERLCMESNDHYPHEVGDGLPQRMATQWKLHKDEDV